MLYFPIRFIDFQRIALFCFCLAICAESSLYSQEKGAPTVPKTLKTGGGPDTKPLLAYPDGEPVGYASTASDPSERNRYKETPTPESVPHSPMVRTAAGDFDSGETILVSDLVPIAQLSEPSYFPGGSDTGRRDRLPRPDDRNAAKPDTKVDPYHPPVRTAAFLNIVPGLSTKAEVLEQWGEPIKEAEHNGQTAHLYSTEILNHIEVIYKGDVVRSIIVRLDEPFPEEQVRTVLQSELLKSKPVLIPDESGKIIGEVFPEKGVLFLFTHSENEQVFMVKQIGIEPVTSEPFVLRAEATLSIRPFEARRDLQDAIRINPNDAKAYGLLARIKLLEGHIDEARIYCEKAIRQDERRPSYHLTLAETLGRMNRVEEARLYLEETLGICDRFPHKKAKALCMLGDLYRTGSQSDYEVAIDYHSDAIRIASSLLDHANPTVRQTAKDVLFEAHLGAARDVAWGQWDEKEESIGKWIAQATEIAEDPEMISAKRFSAEYPFKIAVCTLACQVGFSDQTDIEPHIRSVIDAGEILMQSTGDPIRLQRYQWETSLSLYDAVQIYQLRKRYSQALKYGEIAAEYMEHGVRNRKSDLDNYLLGRLYFRLGAIHAIGNKNHRAAIEWFDRAKPVFERLLPKINPEELGRLGETLVSMGVSYWMTGQRDEAIRLTERGLKQIERGVKLGLVDRTAFSIPYTNLENMYRELGEVENATHYAKLAETIK